MKLTDITTDIRVDISFNVPNSVKSAKLIVVSVVLFAWKNIAFLAHLSRRLTGELIVYPCSGVRRRPSSSVVRRPSFTISKIFSSETARPIEAKLHMEHP